MSTHGGNKGPSTGPATSVVGPDAYGAAAAVGVGTSYARNDHDHGLPAAPADLPLAGGTMSGAIAMGAHKITGLANGSAPQDAACFGQITGGGGGGLLARVQYAPSVLTTYSTASATPSAMDATNLTISFTAPASGDVLVRLSACANQGDLPRSGYFCLLDHTTGAQVGDSQYVVGPNTSTFTLAVSVPFLVTGLAPGTAYQYDWGFFESSTAINGIFVLVQGAQGVPGNLYSSPAVMEVWSA
jgi:hypothetical protein